MTRFSAIGLSAVLLAGCSLLPQKADKPIENPLLPAETASSGLFSSKSDAPVYAGSNVTRIHGLSAERSSTGIILRITVDAASGSFDPRLIIAQSDANRTLVLQAQAVQTQSAAQSTRITFLHHLSLSELDGYDRITVVADKNSKSLSDF